ncbi:MAG: hypothetical protein ACJ780_00920, partial [Solirubrobacteraceae bacterium]
MTPAPPGALTLSLAVHPRDGTKVTVAGSPPRPSGRLVRHGAVALVCALAVAACGSGAGTVAQNASQAASSAAAQAQTA